MRETTDTQPRVLYKERMPPLDDDALNGDSYLRRDKHVHVVRGDGMGSYEGRRANAGIRR